MPATFLLPATSRAKNPWANLAIYAKNSPQLLTNLEAVLKPEKHTHIFKLYNENISPQQSGEGFSEHDLAFARRSILFAAALCRSA